MENVSVIELEDLNFNCNCTQDLNFNIKQAIVYIKTSLTHEREEPFLKFI